MPQGLVLAADDLSGACELAGAYANRLGAVFSPGAIAVELVSIEAKDQVSIAPEIRIFDLDSRSQNEAGVRELFQSQGLTQAGRQVRVFMKLDSLMRGAVREHVAALANGNPVVFCPAVPRIDRVVRDGKLFVSGEELSKTGLWSTERASAPDQITDLLPDLDVEQVIVQDFADAAKLSQHLARSAKPGKVFVGNCSTSAELELLAEACSAIEEIIAVGSAEFGAAFAIQIKPSLKLSTALPAPMSGRGQAVVVVGSKSEQAGKQLDFLRSRGVPIYKLEDLRIPRPEKIPNLAQRIAIRVSTKAVKNAGMENEELAQIFAEKNARPLVLTGGATARAVLAKLKLNRIFPFQTLQHGIVICATENGRLIGIKPGSYGDAATLHALASELESISSKLGRHE